MFAIYAFCRKVDDIADDGLGTRPSGMKSWKPGATIWRRSIAGRRRSAWHSWRPAVAQFGLRKEDFLTILDGMEMDVAEDIVAPAILPRSIFIASGWRARWGGFRSKCSAWTRSPGFDAGPSSGPGPAAHQHPARHRRGCRYRPALSAARISVCGRIQIARSHAWWCRIPRVDGVCRAVAAMAHDHYDKAAAILAKKPKGRIATPRLMGAVYGEILKATRPGLRAAAQARVAVARQACCRCCCARASVRAWPQSNTRGKNRAAPS